MVRASEDDFLAYVLAPPTGETPEDKEKREQQEAEARRVSEAIDEQIRQEKVALKKKKKPVKVLLLGQSESGKSATLKNFQLQYARREWAEERASWRAVIQLNLIRNVIQVLDIVAREMSAVDADRRAGLSSDSDGEALREGPAYAFTDKHRLLKLRLGPLRTVKADLETKLGPGSREVLSTTTESATPFDSAEQLRRPSREFFINSSNGWKSALNRLRSNTSRLEAPTSPIRRRDAEGDEITDVIVGCKNDITSLWEDPIVQQVLIHRKAKIEDSPGFFLTDADRIASHDYEPTDHDIVRARLRTVGVQEHRFVLNEGLSAGREWLMFDVGGTRSSRATWSWYFDDVDAIIFLCPISCFDEHLREDRRINRLEDSYLLWRSVCSSRILSKTQIILFLNKCDLLHSKIKRGMRIRDHIPSFGDRKNDSITVMKYFQSHFKEISRQSSPEPRPFFVHFTSVIDTKATAATLSVVEESILRTHLRNADLL
ncbi:guanine nucleotide binding protein, alpha subunit [Hygrophoropsis aurantiaca]|uniref:Guanine nucleotide binding protein, alpha subunit n=1 Tax=Hygrophoropsis aurantiaca TaxID=72124 RepID=A0ACB8AEK0_9AGAM|nr:guanine nucleotide binding protein, alpha subunit [Hygrophoropsis aurantiaca]